MPWVHNQLFSAGGQYEPSVHHLLVGRHHVSGEVTARSRLVL